ncbi:MULTISPECIES: Rpn family recombination-promoting nuclease/putative transposase [unclassified Paenibacillus]|nr:MULTISPECIES: Rpn family recombination-promoting nuclease/putative transposase [unclassified Paenibacillus]MDF9840750.1 putative transposase/invertase (TIGR01784 family) [Paenibacillus sp. PastF-2]MDF9854089.1 putative transposase/invertase (TIGR01784 family) [Paenibacillus sp. PastF-1]MDH6506905.1 putative transposase/invertase (TIGR01784 family) [Paenibacillus sp. PastM-3]
MELLDPRVDFVFKRIFGSENNKDVLLAFLNCIFTEAGEPPLTEIILMNPYTDKDDPLDKQSIFDVYAKTSEGKLIDIEMQLFNKYDIEKRTLFYWSKRYASQLSEGDKYPELKKCVTINILNYSFIKNEQYHNVFHLREDRTGIALIDDIEVHFLELPKLDERNIPSEGGLINWLLFLKGADTSQWEVLKMNEPGLEKAMDTLQYLSQDSEARRLYEARQKYLHDEASMIEGAKSAGIAEGINKGKKEVARNLLAMGMDYAAVAKATGLSESEIKAIKL